MLCLVSFGDGLCKLEGCRVVCEEGGQRGNLLVYVYFVRHIARLECSGRTEG